ncbi:hypothetical protein ATE84_4442 [Aquimarina sp. MAR_2010_214]|nr:hypothetical protein [Aquimarina sp. MAR_2010_214]PKV52330.1 hypothetical protein ATE84_4442 [Aquimarina sp. MAR_2010_214]
MKKSFTLVFMLFLLFSGRSQETPVPEGNADEEIKDVLSLSKYNG